MQLGTSLGVAEDRSPCSNIFFLPFSRKFKGMWAQRSNSLEKRSENLQPLGQIQANSCFCTARELRIFFTFLNGEKFFSFLLGEKYFVTPGS